MTEDKTKEEYEKEIAQLKEQLKEAETKTGFDEIKKKYEDLIADKDKTIKELEKTVNETQNKVDNTIQDLNNEIDEKLRTSEEYKNLVEKVKQFEDERAEASAEAVIRKGLATPAQKNVIKNWCLNDPDGFTEYFDNAKPIVNIDPKPQSQKVNVNEEAMVDYFKN